MTATSCKAARRGWSRPGHGTRLHKHRRGGRMHSATYRDALHAAALKAGIGHRVAPHQLRHALAVELAREGVPVPLIGRQLGHQNVATTSTYLAGIAPVEVVNVMTARVWATEEEVAA